MMELIKGAWSGLTARGRTIVLVTLIAAVGVVVVLTMAWQYDWRPLVNVFAELSE
jgi:type II secretory pathway component PulM